MKNTNFFLTVGALLVLTQAFQISAMQQDWKGYLDRATAEDLQNKYLQFEQEVQEIKKGPRTDEAADKGLAAMKKMENIKVKMQEKGYLYQPKTSTKAGHFYKF